MIKEYTVYFSEDVFQILSDTAMKCEINLNDCINKILDFSIKNFDVELPHKLREFRFMEAKIYIDPNKEKELMNIMARINEYYLGQYGFYFDRIEDIILTMIQQVIDYQWVF